MLWNNELGFEVLYYLKFHIHGLISSSSNNEQKWLLTGVYGHPDVAKRLETWDLIKSLKQGDGKAWLVLGNFNEILQLSKKWGERDQLKKQMK